MERTEFETECGVCGANLSVDADGNEVEHDHPEEGAGAMQQSAKFIEAQDKVREAKRDLETAITLLETDGENGVDAHKYALGNLEESLLYISDACGSLGISV